MSDKDRIAQDGYQPSEKGYQPPREPVNNGYQPPKQTQQVNPPPKKP